MSIQGEIAYADNANADHIARKPYDDPRAFREFTLALDLIRRHATKGSLLDLGCGPGWTSLFFSRAGYDVTGVDVAPRMIEILRQQADAQKTAVSALVQDVTTLDLLEHDYDIAVFFDALHHVPNYAQAIQRVYEHLAPGGFILLFEPSWLHKFSPHARKAAQRYDVTELGFSRRELRRCLNGAGFANVQQFHDPGGVYGSFRGLAGTLTRIAADFVTAFPKMKRIVTAQKPG